MKINRSVFNRLMVAVAFLCFVTPLAYAEDEAQLSSRQMFASIVNLNGESSANMVAQNNGAIEFQGNELVNSVAQTMASHGTLPLDSTLAMPKNIADMTNGALKAATPMALVEKDLQVATTSGGMALDAIMKDATLIARAPIGIPLGDMTRAMGVIPGMNNGTPTDMGKGLGSGLGTGYTKSGIDSDFGSGLGTGGPKSTPSAPPPPPSK